jgi:uncharacterized protein (DUF433 family)
MSAMDRITVSRDVCGGRPCIRGLRIRVKDVLDLLAAGRRTKKSSRTIRTSRQKTLRLSLEFAARQNDHPVLRSA